MPRMTAAAFRPIEWRFDMHRSRHAEGSRRDWQRLHLSDEPPAPIRFVPLESDESDASHDELISNVESALDFTQKRLDDLREMLDPFPGFGGDDDPPRAA